MARSANTHPDAREVELAQMETVHGQCQRLGSGVADSIPPVSTVQGSQTSAYLRAFARARARARTRGAARGPKIQAARPRAISHRRARSNWT